MSEETPASPTVEVEAPAKPKRRTRSKKAAAGEGASEAAPKPEASEASSKRTESAAAPDAAAASSGDGGKSESDQGASEGGRDRNRRRSRNNRNNRSHEGNRRGRRRRRRGGGLPEMEDIQPDADLPEVVATACGEQVVMAQVLQMKTRELTKMAKDLKVEDPDDYRWAELVAVVLESHYEAGGRIAADCVVEVLPERYGMLRFHHNDYTRSDWDIYVSPSMVRRYNLKTGDSIKGFIRPPKEGEKLWALLKIEAVTGDDPLSNRFKLGFDNLTPLYPEERLHLETLPDAMASRIIDLLVPIGKGQRALVVAPPRAGKTVLLQDLARSVATNHPEAHLIVLLVDERPEEVTDMVRSVRGEVISSTFDEPAARHVQVAEMVIQKASGWWNTSRTS